MEQEQLIARREAKAAKRQAALERAQAAYASEANSSAASQAEKRTGEAEQQLIEVVMGKSTKAPHTETGPIIDAELVGLAPPAGREKPRRRERRGPALSLLVLRPMTRCCPPWVIRSLKFGEITLQTGVQLPPRTSVEAVNHALSLTLQTGLSLL